MESYNDKISKNQAAHRVSVFGTVTFSNALASTRCQSKLWSEVNLVSKNHAGKQCQQLVLLLADVKLSSKTSQLYYNCLILL